MLHEDITGEIIDSFYTVYNELGFGFLEKVYENSLVIELEERGLICQKQVPIKVFYKENKVGVYYADIIVEGEVIIELKASSLIIEHEYQLLNYLKATDIEVGLLLSFGKRPKFIRKVFSNHLKSRND